MTMSNPTAIITGASTGIGRALALLLAKEGFDLGLLARRLDLLDLLKKEILNQYSNRKVVVVSCDVSNVDDCRKVVCQMNEQLGGLNLFIANAGVGGSTPGDQACWDEVRRILEINLMGAIASLEAAKEIMLKKLSSTKGGEFWGHLVGISSVAASRGLPQSSAYCASKAALSIYLESIRINLKPLGITVTSIHPGYVDTPMTTNLKERQFLVSADDSAQKIWEAIKARRPRAIFPWPMRIIYPLLRCMPNPVYDFLMGFRKGSGVFKDKEV